MSNKRQSPALPPSKEEKTETTENNYEIKRERRKDKGRKRERRYKKRRKETGGRGAGGGGGGEMGKQNTRQDKRKKRTNPRTQLKTDACLPSRLEHWDVNNENLHGQWFQNELDDRDYDLELFRMMYETDPYPKLFLNDYSVVGSGAATSVSRIH